MREVIKLYKGLSGEVTKALTELETEFMIESSKGEDEEKTRKRTRRKG